MTADKCLAPRSERSGTERSSATVRAHKSGEHRSFRTVSLATQTCLATTICSTSIARSYSSCSQVRADSKRPK